VSYLPRFPSIRRVQGAGVGVFLDQSILKVRMLSRQRDGGIQVMMFGNRLVERGVTLNGGIEAVSRAVVILGKISVWVTRSNGRKSIPCLNDEITWPFNVMV
jgi:hypothetical protein